MDDDNLRIFSEMNIQLDLADSHLYSEIECGKGIFWGKGQRR